MNKPTERAIPGEVRRRQMLALIEERGFLRVGDLAIAFDISEVTARSDLERLERSGRVERVHGGVLAPDQETLRESSFEESANELSSEKLLIGREAAALVSSGDSIIVDVGTTAMAVAEALVARTDLEDIVVFTNGITTALTLEPAIPRFTVILMGGVLRPRQHSLVQPMSGEWLERLSVNMAFIGCNGIHTEFGVSNVNVPEAHVKEMMVRDAKRVVVVADGSKVGKTSLVKFAELSDVDILITTTNAPTELVDEIAGSGIRLIIADRGEPSEDD